MTAVLLDTTVLIDLLRGVADAANFLDSAHASGDRLLVSVTSAMEVVAGCRTKREVEKARQLIESFPLLQLSANESARAYGLILAYSKSHGLTIPDALIAATALTQNLELATDNDRHFRMLPDLVAKRRY